MKEHLALGGARQELGLVFTIRLGTPIEPESQPVPRRL